jgi:hypothetical protein
MTDNNDRTQQDVVEQDYTTIGEYSFHYCTICTSGIITIISGER